MNSRQAENSIETERLLLRPLSRSDTTRIAALGGDWDVASMTSRMPYPYSIADAAQWVDAQADGEFVRGIILNGELIGVCGYLPDGSGGAEIGYWIGKSYWGQGFATEAGRALVGAAFGDPALSHLVCGHFTDNPASERVIHKLGFVRIGEAECWCEAQGRDVPAIRYHLPRPRRRWRDVFRQS
ncbi:MAG: GNAT family N-acetyltransferase [Pseudomonadota bacterium]